MKLKKEEFQTNLEDYKSSEDEKNKINVEASQPHTSNLKPGDELIKIQELKNEKYQHLNSEH